MYSMCVFSIVFRKFQVGGDTPLAQLILIQQLWGHSIKRMTTVEANSSSNRNLDSRTWGRLLWGRSSSSVESSSCWAWWGLTTKIRSESGRRVGAAAAATEMDSRLFMIELLLLQSSRFYPPTWNSFWEQQYSSITTSYTTRASHHNRNSHKLEERLHNTTSSSSSSHPWLCSTLATSHKEWR